MTGARLYLVSVDWNAEANVSEIHASRVVVLANSEAHAMRIAEGHITKACGERMFQSVTRISSYSSAGVAALTVDVK